MIGTGGVVLIGMGILIWTGEFTQLNITVNHWLQSLGLPDSTPTRSRAFAGAAPRQTAVNVFLKFRSLANEMPDAVGLRDP